MKELRGLINPNAESGDLILMLLKVKGKEITEENIRAELEQGLERTPEQKDAVVENIMKRVHGEDWSAQK